MKQQNLEQTNKILLESFNQMSQNFAQATLDINLYKVQVQEAQEALTKLETELTQLKGGK